MKSVYEVEAALPPGLRLPIAGESTDQYLAENFNHSSHSYEDVVSMGSFVVALILLDDQKAERISWMPTENDFIEMYEAGYGFSPKLLRKSGGTGKLQLGLGFYSREYIPSEEEFLDRLKWVADRAYPLENGQASSNNATFDDILTWGSVRRLLPSRNKIYKMFNGDTTVARSHIGKERSDYRKHCTHHDIYRFGAKVIIENDGPLNIADLNEKYKEEFTVTPYERIRNKFGTSSKFWLEFGYAINPSLDREALLNLGIRWAIQHDGEIVDTSKIAELSRENRFPSKQPIKNNFGGISPYTKEVSQSYKWYLRLEKELEYRGVLPEVTKLASRLFERGLVFDTWLKDNTDTMRVLSADSEDSSYARSLMRDGLNLENDDIFNVQLKELISALKRLGIKSRDSVNFVLEIVPRLNPKEVKI
jgi:hypothetical protein